MDPDQLYVTIGYYTVPILDRLKWPAPSPNPVRKGEYLLPITSVLLGLSTLAVFLRFYTRTFIIFKVGLDDFLIIPGYIAMIAVNVGQIYSVKAGWGFHVWDFKLENAKLLTISGYTVQIAIAVCCLFTKLSILLSYLRFSPPGLRLWVKITMGFVTAYSIGLLIPIIAACNPLHIYWDNYIRTPDIRDKCLSPFQVRVVQYLICAFNIFADIVMMVLPIPTIWALQMPTRQKWSVVLVFLIWMVSTIAAIVRMGITVKTFQTYDTLCKI